MSVLSGKMFPAQLMVSSKDYVYKVTVVPLGPSVHNLGSWLGLRSVDP
jgi:hypothetical protein